MITIYREDKDKQIIEKKWGCEIILHNSDYCGKILKFKKDAKFSMHFHIIKHETWYINKGMFQLTWIDPTDATAHVDVLGPGNIIEIEQGDPHQLIALSDGEIFEASSTHYDSDSYRILKGDNQQ